MAHIPTQWPYYEKKINISRKFRSKHKNKKNQTEMLNLFTTGQD